MIGQRKAIKEIEQRLSKALILDKRIHGPDDDGYLWIGFQTADGAEKITFDESDRETMEGLLADQPETRMKTTFGAEEVAPPPKRPK